MALFYLITASLSGIFWAVTGWATGSGWGTSLAAYVVGGHMSAMLVTGPLFYLRGPNR